MNPVKSIKSRYSATISNSYSTLTISSVTNPTLIGHKGSGSNPGYIFMPYIMQETIILDRELQIKILRANRKEKLKKLGWS